MDKELERMHDLSRILLKQLFEQEKAKKGTPDFSESRLKKIRKTMTQLDQNYKMYAEGMESALSSGGTPQQQGDILRGFIRGIEEESLEAMKLLEDDSVHHIIGSRTGGDTLIEAPGDRVRRVMARLEDEFEMTFSNSVGPDGNLRANMSLSNRAHKWDERARGLEKESGIGKEPTKATVAHRSSTAGHSKNLTPRQLADDDALFEALRANFQKQIDDANIGQGTDAARQGLVRQLSGDDLTYSVDATPEQVAASRKALSNVPDVDIITTYKKGYNTVDMFRQSVNAKRIQNLRKTARLAAGAGVLGVGFLGTSASASETATRTQIASETGDIADKIQAGISGISLAADVASYNPLTAIPGTVVSTGADVINLGIDAFRQGMYNKRIRGRSGAQKAQQGG